MISLNNLFPEILFVECLTLYFLDIIQIIVKHRIAVCDLEKTIRIIWRISPKSH